MSRYWNALDFLLVSSKQKDTLNAFLSNDGFQSKGQIKGQWLEIAPGSVSAVNKDQRYEPTETFVFNSEESSLATVETFDMRKSDRALSSAWSTLYQCKTPQLEESGNAAQKDYIHRASLGFSLGQMFTEITGNCLWARTQEKGNAKSCHSLITHCKEDNPP